MKTQSEIDDIIENKLISIVENQLINTPPESFDLVNILEMAIINHQQGMERLKQAVLNHHVLISAVKQKSDWMQVSVGSVEMNDPDLLLLILAFAKENYIEHLGFQGLFKTDKCSYVTCAVDSQPFYEFIQTNNSYFCDDKFSDFLSKAKSAVVESFDISFPEDFY